MTYLDLRDRLNIVKHDWVDAKVSGTPYVPSSEIPIDVVGIVVSDPLELSIHLMGSENRICISFDDYVIPIY